MSGEPCGHPSVAVARPGRTVPAVAGEGRALTDMQAAFVAHFTTTPGGIGNAAGAARLAGYAENSAKELGHRLVNLPHVQAAIREANQQQISGQIATKAIALLDRVIDDESVPIKTRVDAAKTILDRAGFCALPTAPKNLRDKELAEMTADELRETMRQARAEMDKGATIIDPPAVVVGEGATLHPTTDGSRK